MNKNKQNINYLMLKFFGIVIFNAFKFISFETQKNDKEKFLEKKLKIEKFVSDIYGFEYQCLFYFIYFTYFINIKQNYLNYTFYKNNFVKIKYFYKYNKY